MLTDEQRLLAETAREFLSERSPPGRIRALRADPVGFSWDLWREAADLGWAGLTLPEAHGGEGQGLTELALIMESVGRALAPEPMLATFVAGRLLEGCGDDARRAWLPRMASGEALVTLAHDERGARYDRSFIHAEARSEGTGFRLNGEKAMVVAGASAVALLVTARTGGEPTNPDGVSLFLIPADTDGVTCVPQSRVDARPAALVRLEDVWAPAASLVGPLHGAMAVLGPVLDAATIALAAEALGVARAALELTLEHLNSRVQFGVPIGAFQALQHRAARVFAEVELAASAVLAAAHGPTPALASLAKAAAGSAALLATKEGIQMHGGVGVTDVYDIGLFFTRAQAIEATLGDTAWHHMRWAALAGY